MKHSLSSTVTTARVFFSLFLVTALSPLPAQAASAQKPPSHQVSPKHHKLLRGPVRPIIYQSKRQQKLVSPKQTSLTFG